MVRIIFPSIVVAYHFSFVDSVLRSNIWIRMTLTAEGHIRNEVFVWVSFFDKFTKKRTIDLVAAISVQVKSVFILITIISGKRRVRLVTARAGPHNATKQAAANKIFFISTLPIVFDLRRTGNKWDISIWMIPRLAETFPLKGIHPDGKLMPTSFADRCGKRK